MLVLSIPAIMSFAEIISDISDAYKIFKQTADHVSKTTQVINKI